MVPLVSVLLPYRDAGDTIEEAATSILAERDVAIELIAIDDGSKDNGPECIARLQKGDSRIVMAKTPGSLSQPPRSGIVAALSEGLSIARGEFIARMDGDDISKPGRLARQLYEMQKDSRLGVIGTRVTPFPEEAIGEGMRLYVAWLNSLITSEDHERELFVESPLCHPSVMIRRSALDAVGGFQESRFPEDYDLWLRLDAQGYRLTKVPDTLLLWRHHAGRATFTDPRYAIARFIELKCHYLVPRLHKMAQAAGRNPKHLAMWGAGKTGRAVARALAKEGAVFSLFIDIDPRKIGRTAYGIRIAAPSELSKSHHTVVVAVGARGARDLIRAHLNGEGFNEGADYIFAA